MFKIPALFGQQIHQPPTVVITRWLLALTLSIMSAQAKAAENAENSRTDSAQTDAAINNTASTQNELQNIMDAINNPEAIWLGENDQRFIGFFRPAVKPAGAGVVVLANSNYPSLNDDLFLLSYQMLADYGWSTLRMMLPETENGRAKLTKGSAGNDPTNNAADATPTKQKAGDSDQQQLVDSRLALSVQHLLANNCRFAVLLTGNNYAQQAFDHAQKNSNTVKAVALWQVDSENINTKTLNNLHAANVQIFDIVADTHDTAWVEARKRLFALAGFEDTYQLVHSPVHGIGTLHSSRRIRYWLETHF
jgi:hypothetical protein